MTESDNPLDSDGPADSPESEDKLSARHSSREDALAHWQNITKTANIAVAHDDYAAAIRAHVEAANFAREYVSDNLSSYTYSLTQIGHLYFRLRLYDLALAMLNPAHEIQEEQLQPVRMHVAETTLLIAHCNYAMERYDSAIEFYERTIQHLCVVLPGWHPLLAEIRTILLRCRASAAAHAKLMEKQAAEAKLASEGTPEPTSRDGVQSESSSEAEHTSEAESVSKPAEFSQSNNEPPEERLAS